MKKKTWDLYAPIYKRAMKADQQIYDGWHVAFSKEMAARIAMMYTECVKK